MVFRVLDRNSLKEREGWVKAVYNCGTHNFIPKIQFHDVCLKNYLGGVYMTPGRLFVPARVHFGSLSWLYMRVPMG